MMSELFDEEKLYKAYIRSLKREAIEQGRIEGKAESKAERDKELAEKMRAKGYSEQEIAELLS